MIRFPERFLWGAETSSYQVEGGHSNADWWRWEIQTGKERSGEACRHYELYEQDFDLAKGLDHNAHRLSIEWSRIEPAEGVFSDEALRHYLDVILALKARKIEPVVTLHHFTNPIWFSDMGGWENARASKLFLRYTERVVRELAPYVRYWTTINEPTIYISHGYILGVWPPQVRSLLRAKRVEDNFVRAHNGAFRLIRRIYDESGLERPMVGLAQHMQAFVPCADTLKNRLGSYLRDTWFNLRLINAFIRAGTLDYIGLNYYSRQIVAVRHWGISNMAMDTCKAHVHPAKKNSLGWDIYPEGFYRLLVSLGRYYESHECG
jgi:beta-glucosidase